MPWTIKELLRAASDHLAARGFDSPRLDAELLLARTLGCDRLQLYVDHDRPVNDDERAGFRGLLKQRAAGEPVAYLLGEREFHGLTFAVDRRCLIPRPETEHLVDEAAALVKKLLDERKQLEALRIADVGTGSGCIAISLAFELASAVVVATDVHSEALEVARANAARLVPAAAITFAQGDLCEPLGDHAPFDLIASNPPYITTSEMERLPRDVREFEPSSALHSGDDPVAFHRGLVDDGIPLLKPTGHLVLELPDGGAEPLSSWLSERGLASRTVNDLAGVERVIVISR